MSGYNPEFTPFGTTPLPVPYKDRSTGLTIFGILTILLGCMAALFVPLMLFGQVMSAKATHVPVNYSMILPGVLVYAFLAVVLVCLGIGSIMARRWARALLLIFSWSWLIMGVLGLVFLMFLLPTVLGNIPSNGQAKPVPIGLVMVFTLLIFGVVCVLLPAAWTLFYNSRNVKATCETRDSVTRWTDACPLPVLAFCLWLGFSGLMMLVMPFTMNGVTPFFGMFLSGLPGTLFYLVIAAIWIQAAWWLYNLDSRGWWLILIAFCVFLLSSLLTYAQHDTMEMYRLMGYPRAQLEQMQKMNLFTGNRMCWLMVFSMLPFLGYLLYIKKFFRREPS